MSARALLHGLLGFAAFLLAWQLATWGNGITDGVPPPLLTWDGLVELAAAGVLWRNVIASVFRVAWGFCLAAALGIPLGVWMGWNRGARDALNPLVQMLRPISPIAWLPFAVMIFGGVHFVVLGRMVADSSDLAAIFLIFYCALFPIVTATAAAVRGIELKFLRSAANFGVTGRLLFRRVIVPAVMPQVLTGLRLALGIAWVVVVAAEMLGVQSGLGYQVNDSRNNLRMDWVAAAMVVTGLVGLGLDLSMSRLEAAVLARRGMGRR
jgi:NitT/TauT family transport system permease protein